MIKRTLLATLVMLTALPVLAATYRNYDFGYAIDYPQNYTFREIKWLKDNMGMDLTGKAGRISIQAMAAGTLRAKMPFDEYVKIAAIEEIQNYQKLLSIQPFISDHNVKGYETYWQVVNHEDNDKGSVDTLVKVGPIFYFPPIRQKMLGEQPIKTVMISFGGEPGNDKLLEKDTEKIARSYRYLYSFITLFNKNHSGKKCYVEKGEKFTIQLTSNPTTGFNWFIDKMDESYLKVMGSGYNPPNSGLAGASGTAYFDLMPLKEGNTTIKMLYYRAWEGKRKAVDSYSIKIVVK